MVNLLPLEDGERVTSILPVDEYTEGHFIFMATANGTVKKTELTNFARRRSVGLRALELDEGDVLVGTAITDGSCEVMLFSSEGKTARFKEEDVRAMGRTARGVRGIRLGEGHRMISLIIPQEAGRVLTVSENGYGKRTEASEFPTKGRGNKGVIAMSTSTRNGNLVGAVQVFEGDELMLISNQGTLVRTRADEVSILGRNTQGVRVIRTKEGESLVSVERIDEPEVVAFVEEDNEPGED
jgi:DNA gyrase subunit A